MARLILGPMLRHVGQTEATVWVETDRPCQVAVLGCTAPTFEILGHHYGLVVVTGLAPDSRHPYAVELDGQRAWPLPDSRFPQSCIRTVKSGNPVRILFGSCRRAAPHSPPHTLHPDRHELGLGVDALTAMAEMLRSADPGELPDLLIHGGDQVYSDLLPPSVQAFVNRRRETVPGPPREVVDFEEFARLYTEAWSEPTLRWLLSTVSNLMIFDDHEIHDDWNSSLAWRERVERLPWWHDRMVSGLMTYWVYQHAGNLDSAGLAKEGLLERLETQAGDAGPLLRRHAELALEEPASTRWSYELALGSVRLVIIDSRSSRVLTRGARDMLDHDEWEWLEEALSREADHLLVVCPLPIFLPRGLHDTEGWNEAVCDGAWGAWAMRAAERLRLALDLEHWAAFQRSFRRLARMLLDVAAGGGGWTPSTLLCLGGDLHFGYVAEVAAGEGAAPVFQLTASPMRNRLLPEQQRALKLAASRTAGLVSRCLARLAGLSAPPTTWELSHGWWIENHLIDLLFEGSRASLAVRMTVSGSHPEIHTRLLTRLDRSGAGSNVGTAR
ncbi:MAG: alkaline phosphatase family protein [Candidatus Dormibacteraeota bacterium]|nr:alkaline phosphatase family protein [Candidatus Dormibacteraeota bacterium]MBO0744393.1 alkaline phosphatase family protein [Candidatus Dormibacteraeota bacterium]